MMNPPLENNDCDINNDTSNSEYNKRSIWATRFKNKLCEKFTQTGACTYGDRCMFAHGKSELRSRTMNFRDGLLSEDSIRAFQLRKVEDDKERHRQLVHSIAQNAQLGQPPQQQLQHQQQQQMMMYQPQQLQQQQNPMMNGAVSSSPTMKMDVASSSSSAAHQQQQPYHPHQQQQPHHHHHQQPQRIVGSQSTSPSSSWTTLPHHQPDYQHQQQQQQQHMQYHQRLSDSPSTRASSNNHNSMGTPTTAPLSLSSFMLPPELSSSQTSHPAASDQRQQHNYDQQQQYRGGGGGGGPSCSSMMPLNHTSLFGTPMAPSLFAPPQVNTSPLMDGGGGGSMNSSSTYCRSPAQSPQLYSSIHQPAQIAMPLPPPHGSSTPLGGGTPAASSAGNDSLRGLPPSTPSNFGGSDAGSGSVAGVRQHQPYAQPQQHHRSASGSNVGACGGSFSTPLGTPVCSAVDPITGETFFGSSGGGGGLGLGGMAGAGGQQQQQHNFAFEASHHSSSSMFGGSCTSASMNVFPVASPGTPTSPQQHLHLQQQQGRSPTLLDSLTPSPSKQQQQQQQAHQQQQQCQHNSSPLSNGMSGSSGTGTAGCGGRSLATLKGSSCTDVGCASGGILPLPPPGAVSGTAAVVTPPPTPPLRQFQPSQREQYALMKKSSTE